VFSTFEPVRLDVVGEKLHASRHSITIPLPDLSILRGQTAVLGLRLQNTLLQQRTIGLAQEGLPMERVVLPPSRTVRWDVVRSPELVRAPGMAAGGGPHVLELTGDADGWAVAALEIRNYHVRLGDRPILVVVPAHADADTAGTASIPVALALCLLVLASALVPQAQRSPLQRIANGVALTAFLICLICLVLPRLSPYKVLLSSAAFWVSVGGLFTPLLMRVSSALVVALFSLFQRVVLASIGVIGPRLTVVAAFWKRHDLTLERGSVLLGLVAVAVAQPIFEVVSNSPEFFAARGTAAVTAVAAVVALCFGLPLALLAVERTIRAFSPRTATAFYGVTLAVLAAAVAMPWLRHLDALPFSWDAAIGGLAGTIVALGSARSRIARQFLTALAPAAFVVPTLFFLHPGVRQPLLPMDAAPSAQTFERTPPIVFVIFDELPLNSLVTAEGTIDEGRYPNFAAFAREAYWFRNASSVAAATIDAVPAILSGRYPTAANAVPTLQYYPVNLFTMLAPNYDVFASFRFRQLCPPRTCHDNSATRADTVASLLSDLGLVWLHIVVPPTLAEALPPVTDDWADFARARETPAGEIGIGRGGLFAQFLSSIDGRSARLHLIHSMLPHMAFEYVPSGRRYRGPANETQTNRQGRQFDRASAAYADGFHQRHLAQVGFVDHLLGDLVARLRDVGVYDEALVIVVADHGASYREGRARRDPQRGRNLSDILRVPLLIKLPGQRRGEVVDRIVETVDIVPTILDVLGAKPSPEFDGRSLIGGLAPERASRTFVWRAGSNVSVQTVEDLSAERAASANRKERRFGRRDWAGLYAPPGARHLLGLSRSAVRAAADVRIRIRNAAEFRTVNLARDPLPLYVRGVLDTTRSEPLTVAVVVNGIVAAVTTSFADRGTQMFATLIPETSLREGRNVVAAVAIDGLPGSID
jgi:hypothetical protein